MGEFNVCTYRIESHSQFSECRALLGNLGHMKVQTRPTPKGIQTNKAVYIGQQPRV